MRECSPKSMSTKRELVKQKLESNFLFYLFRVTFLRSVLKWFLRKVTGMCELQRIVKNYKLAERSFRIEKSLMLSKSEILQNAIEDDEDISNVALTVTTIMEMKNIIPEIDPTFEDALVTCVIQIRSYRILFDEVELLRKEAYDCENEEHEKTLIKLWKLLKPDQDIKSRVSKDWCSIGFQGSDPKTDFRGMGILGLDCMVYFAEKHNEKAQQILQHSYHPTLGYSYAIVSINLTSLVYEFFQSGLLRSHFYNEVAGRPKIDDFLHLFCCVFCQFDKFWFESEPENVMAFSRIRENFALQMQIHLRPPNYGSLKLE